jgi:hypothetical protein
MDDNFKKTFEQKENIKEFENHKDLDSFAKYLISKDEDFEENYLEYWNFLKSLDRYRYF